jgi:steroid 5-alpha reductase family enzyme
MKNFVLILNALVLMMTLSIVVLPKFWIVSVVQGTGMVIPMIWTVYVGLVFLTAAVTFSWLARR